MTDSTRGCGPDLILELRSAVHVAAAEARRATQIVGDFGLGPLFVEELFDGLRACAVDESPASLAAWLDDVEQVVR